MIKKVKILNKQEPDQKLWDMIMETLRGSKKLRFNFTYL